MVRGSKVRMNGVSSDDAMPVRMDEHSKSKGKTGMPSSTLSRLRCLQIHSQFLSGRKYAYSTAEVKSFNEQAAAGQIDPEALTQLQQAAQQNADPNAMAMMQRYMDAN